MAGLPEGTLTFMLTDVVGSTRAWESAPSAMREAMARHDRIVDRCLKQNHGTDVPSGRAGDSILAVFPRAADAAACALSLQRDFAAEQWPAEINLEIRVALHSGEAELRQDQYHGQVLNRCARLLATCHGGQVLLTSASEQLLVDELPAGAELRDLGVHRLKDLTRPEHVFELVDIENPREFPPIRSQQPATNLPIQLTAFIGRDGELRQLRELHGRSRSLTLTGPGGSGKTRLALELASEVVPEHADGVWFIELGPVSGPQLVPQAVADTLHLKEQASRRLAETLADHLRERRSLLVLDNCEHVVDTVAELTVELLKECEGLKVLATSREPLRVPGEVTWRVPPLGREEAVRLFSDRAAAHDAQFRLSDDNIDLIVRICECVDRIPLAIELAAARVHMMSIDEILNRLEKSFGLLTGGNRTTVSRQQTLRATLDWSYGLLSDPEKMLFRRLSIFAGRFTLDAAEAVCGDDLLKPDAVLDEQAGELDPIQTRLAAYLIEVAESRRPGHLAEWLDRLEALYDDIGATLAWSQKADPELGMRLAVTLDVFWQLRGHASAPRQFADAILAHISPDFRRRPAALYLAGAFAYLQGDFAAARRRIDEAVAEARRAGDWVTLLAALERSGLMAAAAGDLAASETALEAALKLAREHRDQAAEASILHQLGLRASQKPDLPTARSLLEKSLELRRTLERSDEASMSLTFLAAVALLQADAATARRSIIESLEIGRALHDRRAAWSLDVLACLTTREGNLERALQLAGAGSAMHEASGNTPPAPWEAFVSPHVQLARNGLDPEVARMRWEAGRRMAFDEALEFALAAVSTPLEVGR
ncbi:MAG: adenylate/guanylate cyclase domain-containing protein [Chloroflexi bacterium]|nr:MAG: adenylate/guanylate cyclase domain-containing protein [Chloroflexota bacterium]